MWNKRDLSSDGTPLRPSQMPLKRAYDAHPHRPFDPRPCGPDTIRLGRGYVPVPCPARLGVSKPWAAICGTICAAILRLRDPQLHVRCALGYATKAEGSQAATGYALSVIPALWAFFMTGGGPVSAGTNLIFGFAGLLILDYAFSSWRLTPDWWMPLRILLTVIVIICLAVGVFL